VAANASTEGSSFFVQSLFAFVFMLGAYLLNAQSVQVPGVNQEDLASHLVTYIAPVYPETALAAHVEGDVVVKVEIGPDGWLDQRRSLAVLPCCGQLLFQLSSNGDIHHFVMAAGNGTM